MKNIEFIGVSGSGKSTAIKLFENHLKSKGVPYKEGKEAVKLSCIKKLSNLFSFILKNLNLTRFVFENILICRKKLFLIKRFLQMFYSYEYFKNCELTLFDEGFLLRGVYFHIDSRNSVGLKKDILKKYLKKIPKPNYIIYIETDLPTANRRMMKRGKVYTVKDFNKKEIKNFYTNASIYFESVALEMEKEGVEVIRVRNDNDYLQLERDINKILKNIDF